MDKFIEIGKKLGVKNVQWSGLTKKKINKLKFLFKSCRINLNQAIEISQYM